MQRFNRHCIMYIFFRAVGNRWVPSSVRFAPIYCVQEALTASATPGQKKRAAALLANIKPKLAPDASLPALQSELELIVVMAENEGLIEEFAALMLVHASKSASRIAERRQAFDQRLRTFINFELKPFQQRLIALDLKLMTDDRLSLAPRQLAGAYRSQVECEPGVREHLEKFEKNWASARLRMHWTYSACAAPLAEVQGRLERLDWALRQPGAEQLLNDWREECDDIGIDDLWLVELDRVLSRCHASGSTEQLAALLESAKLTCREEAEAQSAKVFSATKSALDAGVDFGKFAATLRKCLYMSRRFWESMQDRWDQGEAGPSKASEVPAPRQSESDPAYNWPIEKLVEWIDGPVSSPGKQKAAIAPKSPPPKVGPRGKAGRNAGRGREPRGGRVDPSLTRLPATQTVPFGSVHAEGIRRYAAYVLEDLRDMARLCADYNIDTSIRKQLDTSVLQLENTAKRLKPDSDISRERFAEAEAVLERLRRIVTAQKAEEAYTRAFKLALDQCVARSPISYGRHFGGEIECPSQPQAWAGIYETYHNVCLPGTRAILIDGVETELGADRAIAYYVTGSSRSGYAFCISLHLWRRRAESAAPPVPADSTDGRMDTEHWIDTRIPCSVFHVPKG